MRHSVVALALLLSICAVGADNPLQPPIFRSYKVNDGGNVKQRSIIDGLLKRQYSCDPVTVIALIMADVASWAVNVVVLVSLVTQPKFGMMVLIVSH